MEAVRISIQVRRQVFQASFPHCRYTPAPPLATPCEEEEKKEEGNEGEEEKQQRDSDE